jgi:hypothetical protein
MLAALLPRLTHTREERKAQLNNKQIDKMSMINWSSMLASDNDKWKLFLYGSWWSPRSSLKSMSTCFGFFGS